MPNKSGYVTKKCCAFSLMPSTWGKIMKLFQISNPNTQHVSRFDGLILSAGLHLRFIPRPASKREKEYHPILPTDLKIESTTANPRFFKASFNGIIVSYQGPPFLGIQVKSVEVQEMMRIEELSFEEGNRLYKENTQLDDL